MSYAELDDIDHEVLRLLAEDARRTVADIATRVGLSAAPVKRRIDRLEQIGVITGYTVRVDHAKLGPQFEAFAELRLAGDTSLEEIARTAAGLPEVIAFFTTAGDPDALVWLRVQDVAHLRRAIDRLRRSDKVTGTKTLMVLESWSPPNRPWAL